MPGMFNQKNKTMSNKAKFSSKLGLVAATVGSAVGLGNIWRFPAEVQSNGGAAFLLVYILCVLVLGIPLMLAEFSLGRGTQADAVGAFKVLSPKSKWWLTGALGVLASYMILSFYTVVAGWTLDYLWQSITGDLYASANGSGGATSAMNLYFHHKMEQYVCTTWPPLINTFIIIGICIAVLMAGVQKGIERMSTWLMPLLFVILVVFCCEALSFDKAGEGLSYFFTPDFSKITPSVVVNALGQAFFSLSLGMGCLITYGSYFPRSTKLMKTAVTVSMLDMLVAVMMGVIIFPAVFSFGLSDAELRGTTLVFVTLPEVFSMMPATGLWSVLFFTLLLVAALTSAISIGEVSIAFVQDRFGKSRRMATLIVTLPLFALSTLCSLSFGVLSDFKIAGLTIFNLLDTVTSNYMLPTGALLICIFMGWFAPKGFFRKELTPSLGRDRRIYGIIEFIVRWIAPVLILIVLLSSII